MLVEVVAAGRSGYGMSCVLHGVTSKFPLASVLMNAGMGPARRAPPERSPVFGESGSTTLTTRPLFPSRLTA